MNDILTYIIRGNYKGLLFVLAAIITRMHNKFAFLFYFKALGVLCFLRQQI